jgi:mycothiol synthase
MSSSPPDSFTSRSVTPEDAPAINELIVSADVAVQGFSDSTVAELLDWWRLVDLEHDSWFVEDGSLAACAVFLLHGDTGDIDGFVHPERKGSGLGSWILGRGEERARAHGLSKALTWCLALDDDARRLFESRGYREVRRFYRMLIELDRPPPPPEWPEGFRVDTFELDDARAFHAALDEAFAEEWNHVSMTFERWTELRIGAPDFDPTLWFILREGDQIAAVLRGDSKIGGAGWVGAIGVLKPWRKHGLGLALLQHAFGVFYRRGQLRVALGVDAQNPTGATRLYERAGMHVAYEAIAFEKELT